MGGGGDKKENSPSIDLLIQSAILNQHLFILKKKTKITKTVNKKNSQVTASLYTKKFTSLSILGFYHKQLHICPYKYNMPEPMVTIRQLAIALQKAEKLPKIEIFYSS